VRITTVLDSADTKRYTVRRSGGTPDLVGARYFRRFLCQGLTVLQHKLPAAPRICFLMDYPVFLRSLFLL
jgi:hypothetical protein